MDAASSSRPPIEAVVFDIDGTLSPVQSVELASAKLGIPPDELIKIKAEYLAGLLSYDQLRALMLGRWRESPWATRSALHCFFREIPLKEEAAWLVQQIQSRGILVALISSSIDMYVQAIAERLGLTAYFANVGLTFDTAGTLCDLTFESRDLAHLKYRQLIEFCEGFGIALANVLTVGNDINDQTIFTATGGGILITNGSYEPPVVDVWKFVSSLKEIDTILAQEIGS